MGIRDLLFVGLIIGGGAALTAGLSPPRLEARRATAKVAPSQTKAIDPVVHAVDESFHRRWELDGLAPTRPADEPIVLRRLSLALTGSIPSLEEWRTLESAPKGERAGRHLTHLLNDRRSADYLAERLARAYVGTEGGPFLIYRRRRFLSWLSDQLSENVPYDQIVRELIAAKGIWTDRPATNFLTVTYSEEKKLVDPERLAGRVSRAFLGARIDCAQCHDHPFAPWKQADFRGLAAFFGQTENGLTGLHEVTSAEFSPIDRKTNQPVVVAPRVPFAPECLPPAGEGNRRDRLAAWVTDPRNEVFAKATVNRVWALMLGRPLVEPIDDIATAEEIPEALDILAKDFVENGHDLKRLIRLIAASEVFRLDSAMADGTSEDAESSWAVFPMTRLRPEQVVGSVLQASSLTTIDADSPILVRIARSIGESDFVKRFGDAGESEFDDRAGTIPQRLLMLNGKLVLENTKTSLFNAVSRIAYFAPNDEEAIKIAYIAVLTRQPQPEELRHFQAELLSAGKNGRGAKLSDLYWTLINATEFSWNH